MNHSITVSAPGKLMLSGEWAVLEVGIPCIVLAVNKRIYATISELDSNQEFIINLKDYELTTSGTWKNNHFFVRSESPKYLFTHQAVDTALKFIQSLGRIIKPFTITVVSDERSFGRNNSLKDQKFGLGGSASTVVAVITAILMYFSDEFEVSNLENQFKIFKLSAIAHYKAQQKVGSGFDVAAATFGAVVYKRFDPEFLEENVQNLSISKFVEQPWPALDIQPINLPADFELLASYTGTSASTRHLIKAVQEFKHNNPTRYFKIIEEIKNVTIKLRKALEDSNKDHILELIKKNATLLHNLSEKCGCNLEIQAHVDMDRIAAKYGCSGKFSGAGGGDCSIGVCFDDGVKEKIEHEWKEHGYIPLDIEISSDGVKKE